MFCLFDMNCSVVLGHQEGIDNAKNREFHSNHYGFSFIFPLSMFTPPFSPYPPITTSLCPEWIQYSQSDSSMALFHLLFSFPISFIHRYTHSLPRNYSLHSILTSQFITSHFTIHHFSHHTNYGHCYRSCLSKSSILLSPFFIQELLRIHLLQLCQQDPNLSLSILLFTTVLSIYSFNIRSIGRNDESETIIYSFKRSD